MDSFYSAIFETINKVNINYNNILHSDASRRQNPSLAHSSDYLRFNYNSKA